MNRLLALSAPFLMTLPATALASSGMNTDEKQWHFTVYLDDREIGYHRFTVDRQSEQWQVISEARFDVKVWFINAYEYRHYNRETWREGCLVEINAATDDNGELSQVKAQRRNTKLVFSRPEEKTLDGCIRSFAYWSPGLLDSPRLLNTQTGEYQDVEVLRLGKDSVTVRNQIREANRYRIRHEKFVIDLWYSDDDHWLALESSTESGATLRYRIQ